MSAILYSAVIITFLVALAGTVIGALAFFRVRDLKTKFDTHEDVPVHTAHSTRVPAGVNISRSLHTPMTAVQLKTTLNTDLIGVALEAYYTSKGQLGTLLHAALTALSSSDILNEKWADLTTVQKSTLLSAVNTATAVVKDPILKDVITELVDA